MLSYIAACFRPCDRPAARGGGRPGGPARPSTRGRVSASFSRIPASVRTLGQISGPSGGRPAVSGAASRRGSVMSLPPSWRGAVGASPGARVLARDHRGLAGHRGRGRLGPGAGGVGLVGAGGGLGRKGGLSPIRGHRETKSSRAMAASGKSFSLIARLSLCEPSHGVIIRHGAGSNRLSRHGKPPGIRPRHAAVTLGRVSPKCPLEFAFVPRFPGNHSGGAPKCPRMSPTRHRHRHREGDVRQVDPPWNISFWAKIQWWGLSASFGHFALSRSAPSGFPSSSSQLGTRSRVRTFNQRGDRSIKLRGTFREKAGGAAWLIQGALLPEASDPAAALGIEGDGAMRARAWAILLDCPFQLFPFAVRQGPRRGSPLARA